MEQIPTEFKDKIPKDHGYPLGSKVLSDALIDVPQYKDLKAIYKYKDEFWASSYQRKLKQQDEIAVIEVTYRHPVPHHSSSNSFINSGFYEPSWSISIVALPKEYLHSAKKLLQSKGLPKVRDWLGKIGVQTGHQTRKVTIYFDLYKRKLRYESTTS